MRGNALPETALVMPLLSLVLYGLIQIALTAFYQLSADGAAFVGAQKSVALNGAGASLASAQRFATAVFSHVTSADIGVATPAPASTASAVFETSVSKSVAGLGVPGFPAYQAIQSRIVEPGVPTTASVGPIHFCSKAGGGAPVFSLANGVDGIGGAANPIVNDATGAVNVSALAAHIADLQGVAGGLTSIQAGVAGLSATLTQIAALPLGGPLVSGVLTASLGAIQPVLNNALKGSATASDISGLTNSLNDVLWPIERTLSGFGQGGLASQLAAAVTSLSTGLTQLDGAESNLSQLTGAAC